MFIQAERLTKKYGQGEAAVMALREASFSIEAGDFVSVMGPSGSGKSTLLALMGALTSPDRGTYHVDDLDVYALDQDRRADFRREYIGFVFQLFHLAPFLTLMENVMLPLAVKKISAGRKRDLAHQALARVGLAGKENRLPNQVSGGEQERTAIARAVVNEPSILLADEPTGNLDADTGRRVMELLGRLNQEGMTIIMVTHNPEYAAWARRLMLLADGHLSETRTDRSRGLVLSVAGSPILAAGETSPGLTTRDRPPKLVTVTPDQEPA
ncbi:MAG: ABC transporter ATP-binding protein [Thermodesulfobacteriota bacterium]